MIEIKQFVFCKQFMQQNYVWHVYYTFENTFVMKRSTGELC